MHAPPRLAFERSRGILGGGKGEYEGKGGNGNAPTRGGGTNVPVEVYEFPTPVTRRILKYLDSFAGKEKTSRGNVVKRVGLGKYWGRMPSIGGPEKRPGKRQKMPTTRQKDEIISNKKYLAGNSVLLHRSYRSRTRVYEGIIAKNGLFGRR